MIERTTINSYTTKSNTKKLLIFLTGARTPLRHWLSAFAAERMRRVTAIDRYQFQAPALSSKPAAAAVDRLDRRRTDTGPLRRA